LLRHESLAQRANDKRLQQGLLAARKTNFFSCFDLLSATRDPSIHAACLRCTPVIPASAKARACSFGNQAPMTEYKSATISPSHLIRS
jgi:hypothetical protein